MKQASRRPRPTLAFDSNGPVSVVGDQPWVDPLAKSEWVVRPIPHALAVDFISEHHYARGASKTGISPTGLYHREGDELLGALLWLPPVMGAAKSVAPRRPHSVVSLHRLAIAPQAPRNSASFLIGRAIRLLDHRWELCLTYADTGRGHVGTVYQASGWEYHGETRPRPLWRDEAGRMVSPKRGAKNLTKDELLAEGAVLVGRYSKHKYVLNRHRRIATPSRPYPKQHPQLFTQQGQGGMRCCIPPCSGFYSRWVGAVASTQLLCGGYQTAQAVQARVTSLRGVALQAGSGVLEDHRVVRQCF